MAVPLLFPLPIPCRAGDHMLVQPWSLAHCEASSKAGPSVILCSWMRMRSAVEDEATFFAVDHALPLIEMICSWWLQ
eukprot:6949883-Heterocapsa_arctica.AAC.1